MLLLSGLPRTVSLCPDYLVSCLISATVLRSSRVDGESEGHTSRYCPEDLDVVVRMRT